MRQWTINVRLTAWYSLMLAIGLIVFSAVVWLGLRSSLISALQAELRDQLVKAESVLHEAIDHRDPPVAAIREEVEEFSHALPSGFYNRVRNQDGGTVFATSDRAPSEGLHESRIVLMGLRRLRLEMSVSLASTENILQRLLTVFLIASPVILLSAGLGGYWLSKRGLAPVREMARSAQAIHAGELSIRLPLPEAQDDLHLLTRMWNQMLDRLEEGLQRIQRFTSDASHDLRTPVATIRASAEIALRRKRDAEAYEEILRGILVQADRASKLIEDLLTLARAEQGVENLPRRAIDASEFVKSICTEMRPLAERKGLQLVSEKGMQPALIIADEAVIARVLEALLDNAIRYTETGTIRVQVAIVRECVEVIVFDTGIGMKTEELHRVFDRFYRGDQTRSSTTGGSGLGLAIAKQLVELHGGTLEVKSSAGQGSSFIVRLPRLTPNPTEKESVQVRI
ncbi:MAG: sensor histidine kinase [bacterium]